MYKSQPQIWVIVAPRLNRGLIVSLWSDHSRSVYLYQGDLRVLPYSHWKYAIFCIFRSLHFCMQPKAMINMRQFHGPSMPTLSVPCFVTFENQHQVRDSPAVFYGRRDPNVKSSPPKDTPPARGSSTSSGHLSGISRRPDKGCHLRLLRPYGSKCRVLLRQRLLLLQDRMPTGGFPCLPSVRLPCPLI